jgi:hypothetical protein
MKNLKVIIVKTGIMMMMTEMMMIVMKMERKL